MTDLLEIWDIAARVSCYVPEAIEPAGLAIRPDARAWSVGQHFVHLHNKRCEWLDARVACRGQVARLTQDQTAGRAQLLNALDASAHEAAHLGEVGVILAQGGQLLPREIAMEGLPFQTRQWGWSRH